MRIYEKFFISIHSASPTVCNSGLLTWVIISPKIQSCLNIISQVEEPAAGRDCKPMISDKYRCLFIHIPKTGGNSIEFALGGFEIKDGAPWDNDLHRRRDSTKNFFFDKRERHWTWRQYRRHYPDKFRDYFKFAVVRNPFDALVSHLSWGSQGHKPVIPAHWGLGKCLLRNPLLFLHLSPSKYICDLRGRVMVDLVLRFENLDRDWQAAAVKLGLPGTLPHLNKSRRGIYREYYTSSLCWLAERFFARDLRRFGYSFDS